MAAGVGFFLVICKETVGAFPSSLQSILSPNSLWRLERGSETEERTGKKIPFLHLSDAVSGERILRLYHADWEELPVFHGHAVILDLSYCGHHCRVQIDAASRSFVFHPHEWDRPLDELHLELDQAMRNAAKIYVPRSKRKRRKTFSAWLALSFHLLATTIGAAMLWEKHPRRPTDPWIGGGCMLLFGFCAATEIYNVLKKR